MTGSTVERPNILHIMSDQHAGRIMGCAGDLAAVTPHLDRLCAEGSYFERAYCPAPICVPSRMSMLTGVRPHEQTCWTNDDILDSARPTWLHGLGAHGYRPVLIGRLHSLGPDQVRGYIERPIGDHSPNWPGVPRDSLGALAGTSNPELSSILKSGPGRSSYQVMDCDVLEKALEILQKRIRSEEPFCISASFMLPHAPYVASSMDYKVVEQVVRPPLQLKAPEHEHPWLRKWREHTGVSHASPDEVMRARRAYYGLVRQLDRMIGGLLQVLDDAGVTEDTLVVYVSDHGDHIGERGLFWKHTFYEESVNVPLILRWPRKIPAGRRIGTPVEAGGLGNTILSLVGAPELPNSTLRSFAGLLADQQDSDNTQPVFVEYCTDDIPEWSGGFAVQQRAIVLGNFKLVYYNGYPSQLFDLARDPLETNDLIEHPDHKGIREHLTKLVLQDWDPNWIAGEIERRKADKLLFKAWARETRPSNPIRWKISEQQNVLETTHGRVDIG